MDFSPLWISCKIAFSATLITFVLGIFAAWGVGRANRARPFLDAVLSLPLVLPPTVVGFFLLLLFSRNAGFGKLLCAIGINPLFTWGGGVFAATVVSFPVMYRTTRGAFEQVDGTIIAAARTLGMSEFHIFTKIMIPVSLPGIAAAVILSFARALGEHVLTASATFDGVTATDRLDFVITGLPYSLNLASHDEWTQSSSVDWFENDVRLGKNSVSNPQYIQTNTSICIPPSTYYCADYSVNVHNGTVGTTFSIEIGSIEILSVTESGQAFSFKDHVHTGTTDVFKDDNNYATQIYCKNSYGSGQTCSHIYSFTLKYAKP